MWQSWAQEACIAPPAINGTPRRDPTANTASTRQLTECERSSFFLSPSGDSSSERYSDDSSNRGFPSQACMEKV